MRYTVTRNFIEIVGSLWMGQVAAMQKELSDHDMRNINDPTRREDVEGWLACNTGDFSDLRDFRADFTIDGVDIIHHWKDIENWQIYNDLTYGGEADAVR